MPPGARVVVTFVDEGEPRDITALAPDLALVGLSSRERELLGLEGAPVDVVQVADVALQGASPEQVVAMYVHAPTGTALDFPWNELAELVSRGVADQVTAGVAHDAAAGDL